MTNSRERLTARVSHIGANPLEYLKIHLDDVLVSSHYFTTAADGRPLEEFTLNFRGGGTTPPLDTTPSAVRFVPACMTPGSSNAPVNGAPNTGAAG